MLITQVQLFRQLLYSKNVLTNNEKFKLNTILENVQYSCGSVMQDIKHDNDSILTKVYVQESLTCESSMEIPYYGPFKSLIVFMVDRKMTYLTLWTSTLFVSIV